MAATAVLAGLTLLLAGAASSGRAAAAGTTCPAGAAAVAKSSLVVSGGSATATFSLAPGCTNVLVSLASYTSPAATFAVPQKLFQSAGGSFSAGSEAPLTVTVPSCFYQVDLVVGGALPSIDVGSVYGPRKVAFRNGGSASCTTAPPTVGSDLVQHTQQDPPLTPPVGNDPPPPTQTVDLNTQLHFSPFTARIGRRLTTTIEVANSGNAPAFSVALHDLLPAGLHLMRSVGATCQGGAAVVCTIGTLPAGGTASIQLITLGTSPGMWQNTAWVTTKTLETDTANNSVTGLLRILAPRGFRGGVCASNTLRLRVKVVHRALLVATVRDGALRPMRHALVAFTIGRVRTLALTNGLGQARYRLPARKGIAAVGIRLISAHGCGTGAASVHVKVQLLGRR